MSPLAITSGMEAITFGMEAIIPTKIGMPTLRTRFLGTANAEAIFKDLDMEDELWEAVAIRIESY